MNIVVVYSQIARVLRKAAEVVSHTESFCLIFSATSFTGKLVESEIIIPLFKVSIMTRSRRHKISIKIQSLNESHLRCDALRSAEACLPPEVELNNLPLSLLATNTCTMLFELFIFAHRKVNLNNRNFYVNSDWRKWLAIQHNSVSQQHTRKQSFVNVNTVRTFFIIFSLKRIEFYIAETWAISIWITEWVLKYESRMIFGSWPRKFIKSCGFSRKLVLLRSSERVRLGWGGKFVTFRFEHVTHNKHVRLHYNKLLFRYWELNKNVIKTTNHHKTPRIPL